MKKIIHKIFSYLTTKSTKFSVNNKVKSEFDQLAINYDDNLLKLANKNCSRTIIIQTKL